MPFDISTAKPVQGKFDITTAKPVTKKPPSMPGLPGLERTERMIAERPRAWPTLMEEIKKPLEPWEVGIQHITRGPALGIKALGVPWERGEAAIANLMMQMQQPERLPPLTREQAREMPLRKVVGYDIKRARELFEPAWKGLKGERPGRFEDVFRRAGAPDILSTVGGILVTMGIANLATRGKLLNSVKKGQEFLKSKIPTKMGKDYALNRAKVASEGLDDLYKGLSNEYETTLGRIGNRMVNLKKAQDAINRLPQTIINKISKDKLLTRYRDGTIHPQLRNLKRIREILRKSVPDRIWSGRQPGTPETHLVGEIYDDISNLMVEGNPELVALNRRYAEFMRMKKTLGTVLYDQFGNVKSKGLMGLFRPGAERNKQIFFQKFAQMWPRAQQIMKDMIKFSRRERMLRGAGRAARWLTIGGGGIYGVRRILQGLEEGGGGGGGYYGTPR